MAATVTSLSVPTATAALQPPAGEVSQLATSPNELARWTILCAAMCIVVSSVPYGLRCYVRVCIKKAWRCEDWVGLIAYSSLVTYCALILKLSAAGGGVHAWNLTLAQLDMEAYWFNVGTIVYAIAICSAKIAILLLFRRVFSPTRYKPFDLFLLSFIALLLLFYVSTTLVKIFECTPRAKIWDKALPGTCVNVSSLLNTSGLFNTATDIMILLIPIRGVWQLHMARKRKILVVLIFTMGLIAPVVSTVGVIVRWQVSGSPDTSFTGPKILLWAGAEIASCVICFSLPELGALRPAVMRSRKASSKNAGYGPGHEYGDGNGTIGSRHRRPSGSVSGRWPASPAPPYHAYPYPPPRSAKGTPMSTNISTGTFLEVTPDATSNSLTLSVTSPSLVHPQNHTYAVFPSPHTGMTPPTATCIASPPMRQALGSYLHRDSSDVSRGRNGPAEDQRVAAREYARDDSPLRHQRSPSEPPPHRRLRQDEGIVKTVRIEWAEGNKGERQ